MQLNNHHQHWLNKRGVSDQVIELFNLSTVDHPQIGECIKIPFTETHAKYRRDPLDERKPKYLYDAGGKVTLFGADKLQEGESGQLMLQNVVITEGELDALVLWSLNIMAVSSTGGAMSFQPEWSDVLRSYPLFLCFDNDDAGAEGMVRALRHVPWAKVIFIPEQPGVKDISDFVSRGGDFHALMSTAKHYANTTEVEADMKQRASQWLPVRFHEHYIAAHRSQPPRPTPNRKDISDAVLRAKAYPMDNIVDFATRKARCPWHNEATASLHYYPKTNSAYCFGACGRAYDSIDAYMIKHGVSFKTAVEELNKLV